MPGTIRKSPYAVPAASRATGLGPGRPSCLRVLPHPGLENEKSTNRSPDVKSESRLEVPSTEPGKEGTFIAI